MSFESFQLAPQRCWLCTIVLSQRKQKIIDCWSEINGHFHWDSLIKSVGYFFWFHNDMGLILQGAKCSWALLHSLLLCRPGVLGTSKDQSFFNMKFKKKKMLQLWGFLFNLRVLQSLKQEKNIMEIAHTLRGYKKKNSGEKRLFYNELPTLNVFLMISCVMWSNKAQEVKS